MAKEINAVSSSDFNDKIPEKSLGVTTGVMPEQNVSVANQQEALPGATVTRTEQAAPIPPASNAYILPNGEPLKPGWYVLPEEELPRPTYWPVLMALATVLLVFGFITTIAISVVALVLIVISLFGWIGDVVNEQHGEHGE